MTAADGLDLLPARLDHAAGMDQVRGFARRVFVDALLERAVAGALAEIRAGRPDVAVVVLDRAIARADRVARPRNRSDTNPQVTALINSPGLSGFAHVGRAEPRDSTRRG